jgi:A/G-specific adenine glycosylase
VTKTDLRFQKEVLKYYATHGRHNLPWRKTKNPYRILVSEIMLQQTQVDRVIPKYTAFIKAFPTVSSLAEASLKDVLTLWQGLGYNRRAKLLHQCAQAIVNNHGGKFPKTHAGLMALPGIGHYTAGAVMAFSYNKAVPIIETNIRTVIIHHYFKDKDEISDAEIMNIVVRTLPEDVRIWYAALMDYGTHLKKTVGNVSRKSKSYTKQSTFKGSRRQLRGAIIRALTVDSHTKKALLLKYPDFTSEQLDSELVALEKEGLITRGRNRYQLPS